MGSGNRDKDHERNVSLRRGLLYLFILGKANPKLLWVGSICELGRETQVLLLSWECGTKGIEAVVLRLRHQFKQLAQVKAEDSAMGFLLTSCPDRWMKIISRTNSISLDSMSRCLTIDKL